VVYLAARTDGQAGSGTQADPFDVSTAAKFDTFFGGQYASVPVFLNHTRTVTTQAGYTTAALSVGEYVTAPYGITGNSFQITAITSPTSFTISQTPDDFTGLTNVRASFLQSALSSDGMTPQVDNAEFHFAAGQYSTNLGITVQSGWKLLGAGPGQTKITVTNTTSPQIDMVSAGMFQWLSGVQVRDLTLDGGVSSFTSPITSSFVIPAPTAGSNTVEVNVQDSSKFAAGEYVFVQNAADEIGTKLYYGVYLVTAVNSATSITLENQPASALPSTYTGNIPGSGGPAVGSSVPVGALVGVNLGRCGIYLGSTNIDIDDVTVQDVNYPGYEGPVGICIATSAAIAGSGNVVNNCTIQDVYGRYSWDLSVIGNPSTSGQVYSQCTITNCTVSGNGYYQGIDLAQASNCVVENNSINNVESAFFNDTGVCTNNTISGNLFGSSQLPVPGANVFSLTNGASFTDSVISNNTIISNNPYSIAVAVESGPTGNMFNGNHIEGVGRAFNLTPNGTVYNVYVNNTVDPSLTVPSSEGSEEAGAGSGNTQMGAAILVGLNVLQN
jgi:parallel beta-helix repeat protein